MVTSENMQPWRILLAYDGGSFHGWQVQPGLRTVQGTLAEALRHITGETVLPQGSGRTDTGVHALGQVASFALDAPIPAANLLRALNRILPPALRVLKAEHAAADFHARYSAREKKYEYRVFCRHTGLAGAPERICPPFQAPYVFDYRRPLNLERLQQAATKVIGEHDFTSFAASDPDRTERLAREQAASPGESQGNVRTIFSSGWEQSDDRTLLIYRVTGSGFLHHMVRNLVGTFLEVGSGRLGPDAIPQILAARNRAAAGPTAPARGLFLVQVQYSEPVQYGDQVQV